MERSPKNAPDSSELPVEGRHGRKCRYSTLAEAKDRGVSYVLTSSRNCANCCSLGRSDSVTVNPFSLRQMTSDAKRKWMLAPAGPPAVDLDRARSEHTIGCEKVFFSGGPRRRLLLLLLLLLPPPPPPPPLATYVPSKTTHTVIPKHARRLP
jgi:hypothetical protein